MHPQPAAEASRHEPNRSTARPRKLKIKFKFREACLTCPMFVTTAEFLPEHRSQRLVTLQIITKAEAEGHTRLAEMNRQVAENLKKIITVLEADDPEPNNDAS